MSPKFEDYQEMSFVLIVLEKVFLGLACSSSLGKKGIEKMEKIQKWATKSILRSDDCYAERLKKLNLLSLEKRRLLADLTFLYLKLFKE